MSKYRNHLPQLDGGFFLTDSGLETTLVFHDGLDLPHFAAFDLLKHAAGRERLRAYYKLHASIAQRGKAGFILESVTWRASPDWANLLGYSAEELAQANRKSIELLVELRDEFETPAMPMVISGCVGPRGDGYDPGAIMTAEEAEAYHAVQIGTFAKTAADMITAITMTNVNEAIGIARAAKAAGMPSAISFTLETDGRLPSGQALKDAIAEVDAKTGSAPAYFMVNCAHPSHFDHILQDELWIRRLRGIRANASKRSHAELNDSTELDDGNPLEFGEENAAILRRFPHINVLGGCCGTDHRHVEQICGACQKVAA